MPELIIGSFSAPSGKGTASNINLSTAWGKSEIVDVNVNASVENGVSVNCVVSINHGRTTLVDVSTLFITDGELTKLHAVINTKNLGVYSLDVGISTQTPNDFQAIDSSDAINYCNLLPHHDISNSLPYYAVHVFDEKTGFTSNFVKPIDYDKLVTPLSPVGFTSSFPWARTKKIDIQKALTYGYSVNDFLVGGSTISNYPADSDAVDNGNGGTYTPPTIPTTNDKVITIVNTVSVVALPNREPLLFSNIRLSKHIDSFSWDCSLTVLDKPSYNLIKPSAIATQDIEITINGTVWQFFIGKTRKVKQFGSVAYVANGYSHSAKLQAPYAATNNYSNSSGALASQLVNDILLGTGFTLSWSMPVNWPVAAQGFSYQNKSPIDAIAQIASASGAVIEPDLADKTLTIKPWSAESAWNWKNLIGLPVIDEALCFELTEQYTPQDQANAIYVTGYENGAILKGKLPGTAGDKLLPTVNDALITDTSIASERARIELSKSGHKENVPITTFVDSSEPLKMPGDMVTINMSDEANWNGLINNVSISVENSGVEVNQQLNVIRHYAKE